MHPCIPVWECSEVWALKIVILMIFWERYCRALGSKPPVFLYSPRIPLQKQLGRRPGRWPSRRPAGWPGAVGWARRVWRGPGRQPATMPDSALGQAPGHADRPARQMAITGGWACVRAHSRTGVRAGDQVHSRLCGAAGQPAGRPAERPGTSEPRCGRLGVANRARQLGATGWVRHTSKRGRLAELDA